MENLITRIKKHEGFRSKVYKDSLGVLTIGYGRNLEGNGVTEEEADYLLMNDIETARKQIEKNFPWTIQMDYARWGVLLEMLFQLGLPKTLKFKNTLAAMQRGDYTAAAAGMMDSLWAKQTPERVKELAKIMATGE